MAAKDGEGILKRIDSVKEVEDGSGAMEEGWVEVVSLLICS